MAKHKGKGDRPPVQADPPIGPRKHLMPGGLDAGELTDEGKTPAKHHGEMRADQTQGHRGGSQRQTQNRGRG